MSGVSTGVEEGRDRLECALRFVPEALRIQRDSIQERR